MFWFLCIYDCRCVCKETCIIQFGFVSRCYALENILFVEPRPKADTPIFHWTMFAGWCFFFPFHPEILGRFPFWLICFNWVETTNQFVWGMIIRWMCQPFHIWNYWDHRAVVGKSPSTSLVCSKVHARKWGGFQWGRHNQEVSSGT